MRAISRQRGLTLLYTWTIILLGFGWLWKTFPQLNFDHGGTLAALVILGVLSEWMAVPFSQGYLSGSYVIVLATQMIFGGATTAWVTGLVSLIGFGVANRGNPLRTTLFNGSQNILSAAAAAQVYLAFGGGILAAAAFTLVYFAVHHGLVYFHLKPYLAENPRLFGWHALRWDSYTYLFTAPYGALMAATYFQLGILWALVLCLPILGAQFLLGKYVHMEQANREFTALFQMARRLRKPADPTVFFDDFLQECQKIVPYHSGAVYFWSRERQLFLPLAARGPLEREMNSIVLAPGEGLAGRAVETREPFLIDDVRDSGSQEEARPFLQFRTVLAVPLVTGGEVTGVMVLGDRYPALYEDKHIQMLTVLGGLAGTILVRGMLEDQIGELKATDALTGFLNHKQFYQRGIKEMLRSASTGEAVSLLLIDIDHLRTLNARYGHGTGDSVFQMVGSILRNVTRATDILGRYGGGELAVLAPGADGITALKLAELVRVEIRDRRLVPEESQHRILITASIGVATFPQDTDNPDQIFSGAEKAAACAKEWGRDRSVAYSQLLKQKRG